MDKFNEGIIDKMQFFSDKLEYYSNELNREQRIRNNMIEDLQKRIEKIEICTMGLLQQLLEYLILKEGK